MNDNFSQNIIPKDLNESNIPKVAEKDTKKLQRMPFYKLEEIKKQEEWKLKHKNHIHQHKKKDETVKQEKKDGKYKKIIKKREEPKNGDNKGNNLIQKEIQKSPIVQAAQDTKAPQINETLDLRVSNKKQDLMSFDTILNKIEETEDEFNRDKALIKKDKKPANAFQSHNIHQGDTMKLKKYDSREVKTQKFRLSKKQRRLQEGENTLGSFLTKEDKNALFRIEEKEKKKKFAPKKEEVKVEKQQKPEPEKNEVKQIPSTNNDMVLKGKRKKRINKYKKAVYRYRYHKKKFILEKVLEMKTKEPEKDQKIDVNIILADEKAQVALKKEENPSEIDKHRENINLNPVSVPNPSQVYQQHTKKEESSNYPKSNYMTNYHSYSTIPHFHPQFTQQNDYGSYGNYMPYYNQFNYQMMNPFNYYNPYMIPYNHPGYQNFSMQGRDPMPGQYYPQNHQNKMNEPVLFQKIKKQKKKKSKINKAHLIVNSAPQNPNDKPDRPFLFEEKLNKDFTDEEIAKLDKKELMTKIKESYGLDVDLDKMQGEEFNTYLKENKDLKRISIKQLEKLSNNKSFINEYIKNFEGLQPGTNYNKKIVREYVDQVLSAEFDKKFSDFVEKIREMYFKKKLANPLKAKKRFVVGMREVEKFIRLEETKCIFIVPNIEKVEGKNSLDERLLNIISAARKKNIPLFFGLNKFKLGKVCRKKFSSVSILSIINVESLDLEFRNLVEYGETFRKKFYENHQKDKELFKDNKFIPQELFDFYQSQQRCN